MEKNLVVKQYIKVNIPDDQLEEMLKDYREAIYSNAEIIDLFKQVAFYEAVCGDCFCEGIGERGINFKATDTDLEIEEEI